MRNGHAPGHVRDAAISAFEAWIDWDGQTHEPKVELEIDYEPHQVGISRVLGLVWNCTDVMPGDLFARVQEAVTPRFADEPVIKRHTYGACARAVLKLLRRDDET